MLKFIQAIKEKLAEWRAPPYQFPAHIDAVKFNPALIYLHIDRAGPDGSCLEYRSFPPPQT